MGRPIPGLGKLPARDIEAIRNFTLLWSWFEGKELGCNANLNTIRHYAENLETEGVIDRVDLSKYLRYVKSRYFRDTNFTRHYAHLHLERNRNPPEVSKTLSGETVSKKTELICCLIIIYRLRCNFFHGEKWRYEMRGQYHNFAQANKLLMDLRDL